MRVLIIDDSLVMRKIVEAAVRHASLQTGEVITAANGQQGLEILEARAAIGQSVDLILCDLHMPVMDGLAFLLEKPRRNLAPAAPVVMITADPTDPFLGRALAAGANGYIAKPFTLDQVQTALESVLRNPSEVFLPEPALAAAQSGFGGAP